MWRTLKTSKGLQQTIVTIFGNAGATALSAIAMIILSRGLGPDAFGDFSVGFALVLILSRVADAGINPALHKFLSEKNTPASLNKFFNLTIQLKIISSGIILLAGVALSTWLASVLYQTPSFIMISFIVSLATIWYEQLLFSLQGLHRFTEAVKINAVQSGYKLLSATLLWSLGIRDMSMAFIAYMIGPAIPVLISWMFLPKSLKFEWQPFHSYVLEKKELWSMVQHTSVGLIAAGVIENIDVLLVRNYLSAYETGLLGGVSRISLFVLLIAYSLGNVLFPRVARYKNKSDIDAYLKKTWVMLAVTLLATLLTLLVSPILLRLILGQEYVPGLFILNILLISSFLTLATIPFMALFYSFNKTWFFSSNGLLQLAVILIGNIAFLPEYGLAAAAWSRLASRLVLFVFTLTAAAITYHHTYAKKT